MAKEEEGTITISTTTTIIIEIALSVCDLQKTEERSVGFENADRQ